MARRPILGFFTGCCCCGCLSLLFILMIVSYFFRGILTFIFGSGS
ncbi:MAG TPA: hypothetical protein PK014_04495 [Thermoanaerobaculia bacterium]|nr:hypothetical protein [Thermoanaerobaculia bacterium]HUM29316.1 hypothetical protein [Thermoanaerobaculia bacterium]HXK67726.1 hypothetical protein [Thermoanaerobaculia bacterium]